MSARRGPAAGLLILLACAAPAAAQEAGMPVESPLVLRIQPRGTALALDEDTEEAGRRAVAAREAFEARITARARRAIASVCTGCLSASFDMTGAIGPSSP
ncbi:hypothetical protein [Methylobacterium oryzisoli]|uniref:hypothetical protein n=1 Tax=Methylobacterium oryzisoli TaxID=3385502 RepID=UPI003892ADB5